MDANRLPPLSECALCHHFKEVLLWQNEYFRIIAVNQPNYPGYCRIIWQHHTQELTDLTPTQQHLLFRGLTLTETVIRKIMQCDKINLASLGNVVPHLHWHIIPRFRDDKHFPESIWGNSQRNVDAHILLMRTEREKQLPDAIKEAFSNF